MIDRRFGMKKSYFKQRGIVDGQTFQLKYVETGRGDGEAEGEEEGKGERDRER